MSWQCNVFSQIPMFLPETSLRSRISNSHVEPPPTRRTQLQHWGGACYPHSRQRAGTLVKRLPLKAFLEPILSSRFSHPLSQLLLTCSRVDTPTLSGIHSMAKTWETLAFNHGPIPGKFPKEGEKQQEGVKHQGMASVCLFVGGQNSREQKKIPQG